MITKYQQEKFINDMKLRLDMCNYGFQLKDSHKIGDTIPTYSVNEAKNCYAIKELFIRFNVWLATGKLDKGEIDYPEAKRKIVYHLDSDDINKCKIAFLRKRLTQK